MQLLLSRRLQRMGSSAALSARTVLLSRWRARLHADDVLPLSLSLPRLKDPHGYPGTATSCWSCICAGSNAAASPVDQYSRHRLRRSSSGSTSHRQRAWPHAFREKSVGTAANVLPYSPDIEMYAVRVPEVLAYRRGIALLPCSATGSLRSFLGQHVVTLAGRKSELHNLFFYSLESVPRDAAI